jgi:hypothetical protein
VLIGKDFEKVHTSTCEVLLSGGQFSIMVADEHMNLQMLVFDPKGVYLVSVVCECVSV